MNTDDIIPSILPEIPPEKLTIIYPSSKLVDFGNELTPHDVTTAPQVSWTTNPDKYYTLLMVDPDAPSRKYPIVGEVCHWLISNIKGDLSTGDVIGEYRGSGPPRGTGLHRYIFVLFEHDERVTCEESFRSRMRRLRFSTKKFMEKYKFDKVYAWNYFKAQWTTESKTCVLM